MTPAGKYFKEVAPNLFDRLEKEGTISSICSIMEEYRTAKITSAQHDVIKSVCRCKEGKQGRTVDENWNQICDVCGGS